MKKIKFSFFAAVGALSLMTSCGLGTAGTASSNSAISDALIAGAIGSATGNATTGDLVSGLLGNVIGQVTNSASGSIVGTWVYQSPAVEFRSADLLAQAGGQIAAQTIVNKVQPYFTKYGLQPGKVKVTFNEDNTCTYAFNNTQYSGQYVYDPTTHTVTITGATTGLAFPACSVTIGLNQMNMTFAADKILTLLQNVGTKSSSSALSSVSSIAKSFNGMQIGFQFNRQ